ncbi:MAG: fluoride efflux transporter CrcB [Pseudomonadota bacterium]
MSVAQQLVLVAMGGAVGAIARYGATLITHHMLGRDFPYGTLLVNVLGSFAIGIFFVVFVERVAQDSPLRLLLIVGVLGAFTTFSTFSLDTLSLIERGALSAAVINVLVNVALCLAACWVGLAAARELI